MSILETFKDIYKRGKKPEPQKYMRGAPPGPSVKGRTELAQKKAQAQAKQTENPYRSTKKSNVKVGTKFGGEKVPSKKVGVFPKTKGAYKIKKGDTLSGIAKQYGTSVSAIMKANKALTDPNKIRAGAGLTIPGFKQPLAKTQTAKKRVDPTKDPRFNRIFGTGAQTGAQKKKVVKKSSRPGRKLTGDKGTQRSVKTKKPTVPGLAGRYQRRQGLAAGGFNDGRSKNRCSSSFWKN